jgi:hypothetical protein
MAPAVASRIYTFVYFLSEPVWMFPKGVYVPSMTGPVVGRGDTGPVLSRKALAMTRFCKPAGAELLP